jgi:hypothetical protein
LIWALNEGPRSQDEDSYENYGPVDMTFDSFFERGPRENPGPIGDGIHEIGSDSLSANGVKTPGSRVLGGAPLTTSGGDGASQADSVEINLKRLAKRLL